MEVMRKQEDFHTKYAKDKHNFDHGGAVESMHGGKTMMVENPFLEDVMVMYYEGYHVRHDHYEHTYDTEVHGESMHGNYEYNDSYSYRGRRMGLKSINTWSLMKQAFSIRCGVKNHKGQGQDQIKVKLMESLMVEKSFKTHAMEEKRRVGQGSFNEGQSVSESISTSLEECEYKKNVVSTK
ncbi:hypothetical protein M9H77_03425 [Catharanthus roseus]|uniref:Uncharacterized protein n=1 Tax=Catharanthus roseus TaxID=4058 RepID=A0ACC0CBH6_CATRO|nr:hypothetical protein M9H77_03425 [Catharanthus roseus]